MRHFTWLDEKKRAAAANRQQASNGKRYGAMPVRMRYLGNTGAGDDGVIQPEKPTHMLDTNVGPRMIHEDENVYTGQNGELQVIPSRFTQRELEVTEREQNVPGYQTGISTNPVGSSDLPPDSARRTRNMGIPTAESGARETDREPTSAPTVSVTSPRVTSPSAVTVSPAPRISSPQTVSTPQVKAPTSAKAITMTPPPTVAPVETITAPRIAAPVTTAEPTRLTPPPSVTPPEEVTAAPVTETPSAESRYRTTAMGRLSETARGVTPEYDAYLQKQIDDAKATQAVEQQVLAQQAAQTGTSEETLAARQAMERAAGRQAIAELTAEGALNKAQLQQQATQTLASQSLAGQRFEQEKAEYGDTSNWREYEAAVAAGDFDTAAAAYKGITGKDLSTEELQNYQDYLNKSRAQELATGEINLDSLRNTLGDQKFSSIQDRINSGASLDAINREFGTSLSQAEYNGMLEATPLGERGWDRQLEAANMLLSTPGADKNQAAQIYSDLFPGVDFDFTKIAEAEQTEEFGTGISSMASYAASNMNWEDAKIAMQKDKTFDKMGVTEAEAEQLYNGMKVNAIDASWNEVSNSAWFNNLPAEDQEDMQTFFTAAMKGDLDYDILPEIEVYDADGNLKGTFTSMEAAQAEVAGNTGYTLKDTGRKRVVPRNLLTGTTGATGATNETALPTLDEIDSGVMYRNSDGSVAEAGDEGAEAIPVTTGKVRVAGRG